MPIQTLNRPFQSLQVAFQAVEDPATGIKSDNQCLGMESFTNKVSNQNTAILQHTLRNNDLNAYLNTFKTDTPIGKAYRKCADGLCYYDRIN